MPAAHISHILVQMYLLNVSALQAYHCLTRSHKGLVCM